MNKKGIREIISSEPSSLDHNEEPHDPSAADESESDNDIQVIGGGKPRVGGVARVEGK